MRQFIMRRYLSASLDYGSYPHSQSLGVLIITPITRKSRTRRTRQARYTAPQLRPRDLLARYHDHLHLHPTIPTFCIPQTWPTDTPSPSPPSPQGNPQPGWLLMDLEANREQREARSDRFVRPPAPASARKTSKLIPLRHRIRPERRQPGCNLAGHQRHRFLLLPLPPRNAPLTPPQPPTVSSSQPKRSPAMPSPTLPPSRRSPT